MKLKFKHLQPETSEKRLLDGEQKTVLSSPMTVYIDNELVARTRQGDTSAFEELFNRHRKRIFNIAMQMLQDETEAADATQEVFVRTYRNIGKLQSDGAFVTWLKTMVVNHCRDILRKRGRVRVDSLDSPSERVDSGRPSIEVPDSSNDPAEALDKKQTQELVQKAISSLAPEYREAVTLFYVDGAEVSEIAKITASPVGTVKCRLSRARAELKRKLEWLVKDQG